MGKYYNILKSYANTFSINFNEIEELMADNFDSINDLYNLADICLAKSLIAKKYEKFSSYILIYAIAEENKEYSFTEYSQNLYNTNKTIFSDDLHFIDDSGYEILSNKIAEIILKNNLYIKK